MVNARATPKNIALNTHEFMLGISVCTLISNVTAPVLGIARPGPIQRIHMDRNTLPGISPIFDTTPCGSPLLFRTDAQIASTLRPTSTIKNPMNPTNHALPTSFPKNGGKIRLPAPKNVANKARPIINIVLVLLSFI